VYLFCLIDVFSVYYLSSPFLFVLDDDHVILYTGAIDDTSGVANT